MTVKGLYEKIHGDYQRAISVMMMDDFIKRMLTKFVQSDSSEELFKAYENKDYQGVFAAAHSIKGVVGNLALTSLFDKIVPIVEATRNFDNPSINIDKEVANYKNEHQFVMSELKKFLNL